MKSYLIKLIDLFYFLFKRFMPLKTYRYAVCGGGNLVLDTILYYVFFHFIVAKRNIDMHFFVLSPHIASLFFVFPITFLTGFLLNKYITFEDSNLAAGVQFYRYLLVGCGALILSYGSMKLLVDGLQFFPTPSKILTIGVTIVYSYILQSRYSFKVS